MIDAEEVINKIKDDKYYTYEELTVVLNYIDKLKEENQNLRIINNTLNETYKSIENRNNLLQQQLSDIDNKLKEFGIE